MSPDIRRRLPDAAGRVREPRGADVRADGQPGRGRTVGGHSPTSEAMSRRLARLIGSTNVNPGRGAWVAIGIGVGTAVGVATGSLAIGIALGVVFGLALGARRR